ncbi:MAG: PPC domain-containing protein [Treponema sp.]|jgi:hypothetical protein|nr:PPC domain-containing protein [Treponema sp.]
MRRVVLMGVVFVRLGFGLFAQNSGDDSYEPDSRESPVAVQLGTWFSRALHRGDEDWFALRSASTGLLIAVTGGDADTVITLYRGNEAVARNDDNGDDVTSLLEYPVQSGTDYTFCVEGYDEGEAGPYRFMVSFEPIRDVGEPNNVASQATSFRPDSRITGYLLDPDDVDWYRVTVAAAGTLRVYTEGTMDTVLLIYDANDTLIAKDDDSGENGNALVSTGVTPRTVFVRVSSYDGQLGRYTLRGLLFETATPDRFEPDDTRAFARDIAADAPQERNFADSSDEDWARLRITQGGTYDIFVEAADGALDTFLELYDSDENLIDANDDWDDGLNARLRLELNPGTYYIKASTISSDPLENSEYVLSVGR